MASDPLDLVDLAAATGGEQWTGPPGGSVVGHIHLHVGDLAQADGFYHSALGFGRTVWSYPGALFLAAGGYHHHLGVNTWAQGARPAGELDARLLEWEIVLPAAADVAQALASVRAAGHDVEPVAAGGRLHDPWGTPLLLKPENDLGPSASFHAVPAG